ncbi:MBL fold metallo-hydrolase [Fibrobacter sp. UWEL]|uniref:MBL fold metallo-hydrolase n=1 Tax=Fibrobacter sp. UWEL TaxID=1896209 RepID=UPI0009149B40|nr:MBL fold metallo-hydrolase [Fibrobacter sp. UWEL]SHL42556.1 Glyoxylase, beta-lactamase superfamily II [Fibrobacter sp. UWEL]
MIKRFALGAALALTITACEKQEVAQQNSQTQAESAAEGIAAKAVTKTITLADGSTVTWIQDNAGEKMNPRELFSDASDSLYNSMNLPNGVPASVSTYLLKADGEYVLFDAGLGAFGGQMLAHLNELGVSPDSVKKVYLTHLHVDHINGLVAQSDKGMEKVFKNAEVYVGSVEKDAWMNMEKNDLQKAILGVYNDKLKLFAFGDTLPHNVIAMDAVGHTPGHTVFQKGELLVIGDLMHGYALQIEHPEINSNYDMDKEKSIESRKKILAYAKANNLTMAGMHLPPPGFVK